MGSANGHAPRAGWGQEWPTRDRPYGANLAARADGFWGSPGASSIRMSEHRGPIVGQAASARCNTGLSCHGGAAHIGTNPCGLALATPPRRTGPLPRAAPPRSEAPNATTVVRVAPRPHFAVWPWCRTRGAESRGSDAHALRCEAPHVCASEKCRSYPGIRVFGGRCQRRGRKYKDYLFIFFWGTFSFVPFTLDTENRIIGRGANSPRPGPFNG
jgi:hypothetical protein